MERFTYVCADPGVPLPGTKGASVHVASLCRALVSLGLTGEVHTVRPEQELLDGLPLIPIEIPPRRKHKSIEDRENRLFLARLNTPEQTPDFIYERYSLWHPGGLYLARTLGVPLILEVNSPLALETKRFRKLANEPLADGLSRLLLREADAVVCVSDEIKEWVISERLHSNGVRVVPNGVDETLFQPSAGTRPEDLPDPDVPLIGFTSTFRPWHGTKELLESFRFLVEDLKSPAHLLCIGDGPDRGKFLEAVNQAGLAHRVHAPGKLPHDQVGGWLASCDLAVAPYPELDEFWYSPLKIFEYFCCALPVVATDVGQIRDLLGSDRGELIPIGDTTGMARSIHEYLTNPPRARALGEKCRDWVLSNATWKIRAQEILQLVEAIQ